MVGDINLSCGKNDFIIFRTKVLERFASRHPAVQLLDDVRRELFGFRGVKGRKSRLEKI